MASDRNGAALRSIHALFTAGTVGGLTDGTLLERFATGHGESAELAFAALVERHGPMVLRVCRGVLRDGHDAEDAFQATFLILARKAHSVWVRESLGPWLHGVAYNVASTARSAASRRRSLEREAAEMRPGVVAEGDRDDLGAVVHEELNRLPGRYRSAVVLCCLEGLTQQQAAQRLGWPLGTVQSRLARGRERLRVRLTRRGLAPSAGVPVAILSTEAVRAAVPASLASATIRAATRFAAGKMAAGGVTASVAALTDGVLKNMALTKLMTVGASGLLLGVVLTGAGLLAQTAGEPSRAPRAATPPLVKYEIRIWRDGKPAGEPVVAERTLGASVHIETPHGRIDIRPASERAAYLSAPENVEMSDPSALPPGAMRPGMEMMGGMMGMGGMPGRAFGSEGMGGMSTGSMPSAPPGNEGMAGMMGSRMMGLGMRGSGRMPAEPQAKEQEERERQRPPSTGMMMGGSSLDRRMTEMERKLDQILRTLEDSNATKGPGAKRVSPAGDD